MFLIVNAFEHKSPEVVLLIHPLKVEVLDHLEILSLLEVSFRLICIDSILKILLAPNYSWCYVCARINSLKLLENTVTWVKLEISHTENFRLLIISLLQILKVTGSLGDITIIIIISHGLSIY